MPPICSTLYPNPLELHGHGAVEALNPRNGVVHIRLVPHISFSSSHCYVFDIIEREIQAGTTLKLGRYNSSHGNIYPVCVSFKSKVVSRSHADIYSLDGKVYIRDVGSSSGTFVNRTRLGQHYRHQLRDGDVIQLGVDYQNGTEPTYRAVRMKIEIGSYARSKEAATRVSDPGPHPTAFARAAFEEIQTDFGSQDKGADQACCICLCRIRPTQALFVAPCFHIFHFACLRLFIEQHFPAFLCPLCRTYSDLNASLAMEDVDLQTKDEDQPGISTTSSEASSLRGMADEVLDGVGPAEPKPQPRVLPRRHRRPMSSYAPSSSSDSNPTADIVRKSRSPLPRRSTHKRCSVLANAMINSPPFLKQIFGNRGPNV